MSIFFKISGDKLSGIKNPYDVWPSSLLKFKLVLVSSGCFDSINTLLIKVGGYDPFTAKVFTKFGDTLILNIEESIAADIIFNSCS